MKCFQEFIFLLLASFIEITQTVPTRYSIMYGNVIGEMTHRDNTMPNITEIVSTELLVIGNEMNFNIHSIEIMFQYHSIDEKFPTKILYNDHAHCYEVTLFIGTMFVVIATTTNSIHYLSIIEDVNKEIHVYSHTYNNYNHIQPLCDYRDPFWSFIFDKMDESCRTDIECDVDMIESDWSQVSIATYNIWNVNSTKGETHWKRLKRLTKVLSKASVDIIAFQEVRTIIGESKRSTIDQIRIIRKGLSRYQYVYQPAMMFEPLERNEEGVAIFSRFPIISSDYILLPWNRSDPSDFHQRVCLQCTIDTPSGLLNIFVTHLSLSQTAQMRSVIEIYNYMNEFSLPAVLMGDLNAEPDSPPIQFLNGEIDIEGVKISDLTDVWNEFDGNTFSAVESIPTKRIDYIFLRDAINICVESVFLIGTEQRRPVSDHYGLTVNLKMKQLKL